MHTQFEQNKAFSSQLDEHSSILQNISKQLESLNSDISSLQTRLTPIETYVSNMSHTQPTLINQMAAKPEVISKEEERAKSLPTYHTVATIQVVEDVQTVSTHHTPSPTGPINGDATTSTTKKEYTNSAITPTTTIGAYKSNVPCDYTSCNGELCPWHGLPGKEPDLWFEKPQPPQTWEEVKTLNTESRMNEEEDINNSLIDSSDLDFDNWTLPEVIGFLHKISRDPHTSTHNLAFTKHITNALIKVREDKLGVETSIPRKLEDGWDPMIKIKFNNLSCFPLC